RFRRPSQPSRRPEYNLSLYYSPRDECVIESEAALIWTCTEGGRIVLRAVHQSRAEQHRNTHFIQYSVQVPNFILVQ
ncbi:hypothetical protein GBAR_LOCUS6573, partial [Geodia barretti]